jgi:hypothetical protein
MWRGWRYAYRLAGTADGRFDGCQLTMSASECELGWNYCSGIEATTGSLSTNSLNWIELTWIDLDYHN